MAFKPEAAGYRFTRRLDAPATVLIGGFDGGTSDFPLLRFEPGAERPVIPLATMGAGVAGDCFNFRIIHRVVPPRLARAAPTRPLPGCRTLGIGARCQQASAEARKEAP